MKNQRFRFVRSLLLVALSFLLTTVACYNPATQEPDSSARQLANSSECRIIQHSLGEICIPLQPQRIVALDIPTVLDSLIALDIKPVGRVVDYLGGERYFPNLLPDEVAGIETVGREGTPSLEKVLKLKPDLILLVRDGNVQTYEQLSDIAPTAVIDVYRIRDSIKDTFRYIAQLVNREEKAEIFLSQYEKRVAEFQEKLGNKLAGLEISVIDHFGKNFWLRPKDSAIFQVFKEVGIPIKPMLLEYNEAATFSIEAIDQYDADILFIIEDGSASYLSQQPLIQSLESVKNNRAYIVSRKIWDFGGPIGMNLFLDDISKYLLEGKKDPYFERS
ncbi:iron-siderophore ABC transporter substrate-binding protein [Gloeocapsopsis sp. IPPAS B-1203]|uniref:ABC transporter substrate-binding protein n=1 Tax=Gloeocapsopsis sp. IPPAS B-1203 TaxID=2049454 RepID=UPI000C1842EA|nr:iron-siderophore ABC transporter substrate-binding protein [Gloeocapsopsis sp. IPPAS B-1203]PIG90720.1 hypothetical protein CSQ79_24825 [Gloeocapsopsis sp. IPPAS B-1203]